MADAKRISASITVPASLEEEVLSSELNLALESVGVSPVTIAVTRTSGTVLQVFGDALVPTGQANATTVTAITGKINAMVLEGVTLVAGAVTCNNASAEASAPAPDDTFANTAGGSGRPPW